MTHLTQTTQLDGFLTSFSVAPGPGAGAGAGEEAGLLACFMLPKSSGYLGGQPWYTPRSKSCGEPLRGPKCWVPALPAQQGPHLLQLLGAALAECPPACEVLPEGVPRGSPHQTAAVECIKEGAFLSGSSARATRVRPWVTLQLGQEASH